MIIARWMLSSDITVFGCSLKRHAPVQRLNHVALNFLPRRLMAGIAVAALLRQTRPTLLQRLLIDQQLYFSVTRLVDGKRH